MMLNISNPINIDHKDNNGLRFCLLASQEWTNGKIWRDVVNDNIVLLQAGVGSLPTWKGNRLVLSGGNYLSTPITDLSGNGTIIWDCTNTGSYNDGNISVFWGQSAGGGNPEISAQKFLDGNLYVGWYNSSEYRVTTAANPSNYPTNIPTRYAFTWIHGGLSKLYVNGNLIASNSGSTNTVNITSQFNIGKQGLFSGSSSTTLNGTYGETRIYNIALDSNAIYRDYEYWRYFEIDPRLQWIDSKFYSIPSVVIPSVFIPSFQPSFWGSF